MTITSKQVSAILALVAALAGAVVPVVTSTNWSSTAGIEVGVLSIVGTCVTVILGAQRKELQAAEHAHELAVASKRQSPGA